MNHIHTLFTKINHIYSIYQIEPKVHLYTDKREMQSQQKVRNGYKVDGQELRIYNLHRYSFTVNLHRYYKSFTKPRNQY